MIPDVTRSGDERDMNIDPSVVLSDSVLDQISAEKDLFRSILLLTVLYLGLMGIKHCENWLNIIYLISFAI